MLSVLGGSWVRDIQKFFAYNQSKNEVKKKIKFKKQKRKKKMGGDPTSADGRAVTGRDCPWGSQ